MTTPGGWVVELFVDAAGSCPYERFIDRVDDTTFAAVDAAVEHVLTRHGLELCKTEWMKPLGEGLYEFRIRHDATEIADRFGQEPAGSTYSSTTQPPGVVIQLRRAGRSRR
jgi:hypothetical protein